MPSESVARRLFVMSQPQDARAYAVFAAKAGSRVSGGKGRSVLNRYRQLPVLPAPSQKERCGGARKPAWEST